MSLLSFLVSPCWRSAHLRSAQCSGAQVEVEKSRRDEAEAQIYESAAQLSIARDAQEAATQRVAEVRGGVPGVGVREVAVQVVSAWSGCLRDSPLQS